MAELKLMPFFPTLIPEKRFAVNGRMPSPNALGRAAHGLNTIAGFGRQVFTMSLDTQSTPAGGISNRNHYFCFRTGENVERLTAIVGLAPADGTFLTNPAEVRMELDDGVSPIYSEQIYYPEVASGVYAPSEVHWARFSVDTGDGLAANTKYVGHFRQNNYSRIHSITVFEEAAETADSTVTGICDAQAFEQGKPIYGAGTQDLLQTGTKLWQHNGAQLVSFSRRASGSAPSISGLTWQNLLKTGSSTFGSNDPGYHFRTTYHDSLSGDVPCEIAIYGALTSGSGNLDCKLVRNSGDIVSMLNFTSGISSAPGQSQAFTMPAMDETVQIFLRASSTAVYRIDAIGIWEYEA